LIHWGEEFLSYPSPGQITMARAMVDAGADYVIGHHSHVLQCWEEYKGGNIFYSLGNLFLSPFFAVNGRPRKVPPECFELQLVTAHCKSPGQATVEMHFGQCNEQYELSIWGAERNARETDNRRSFGTRLSQPDYPEFWQSYAPRRWSQLRWWKRWEMMKRAATNPVQTVRERFGNRQRNMALERLFI
jgi:hypothetical protein